MQAWPGPVPVMGRSPIIGVRLDENELVDPGIQHLLSSLNATAVVDNSTAEREPEAVQHLVSLNVDVESGGAGTRHRRARATR